MEEQFTFGNALKIIFKYVQASPAILAEKYVDRDRTLVYKWLRGAAFPSKKLFPDIIRFVMDNSSDPIRAMIRAEMDPYLLETKPGSRLGKTSEGETGFADYLESVFVLLAAEKALIKNQKPSEATELSGTQTQPASSRSAETEEKSPRRQLPDVIQDEREIHIRLTHSVIKRAGFALLAAVSGEVLWAIAVFTFQWQYTSGIPYDGLTIFPAFLRGILLLPVLVFAMASLRGESLSFQATLPAKKLLYVICYALAAGIGGLLLTSPGLDTIIVDFVPASVPQAMLLVVIHALVLSFLPLLSLFALLRFPRVHPGTFLFLEFGPALLCALAALPVLLTSRSPIGRVWLGGLFPGCILNLLMFLSARLVLKGYPGIIKLTFPKIPSA